MQNGRAAAQYAPVTATQLVKTAIVVLVFSLHNGWNCFVFLVRLSLRALQRGASGACCG